LYGGAAVLITGLVIAFLFRGDLVGLEPLSLRLDNWRTATWLWTTSPVTGVGFGSFGQACQTVPFAVGNRPLHAHSLPFEWIAELGILGLVAVAIAALWFVGIVRKVWPHRPELAVAVAIVPLHNLVDFSLYTSGVAVPWAVLLGWAAASAPPPRSSPENGRGRAALVACASLMVAGSILHSTSVVVERSGAAAVDRFDSGVRAHRLAPWRAGPMFATAAAALEEPTSERLQVAAEVLERGRRLRPRSAAMAATASRIELAQGRIPSALADAWSAAHDRPLSREHRENLDQLLERLEEAEDAAGR
jgi:hypothetical protein